MSGARSGSSNATLVESLTTALRSDIVEGRIAPGTRIRQADIARKHGMSRIPVREAIVRLATEGLLTVEPHVGATVAKLDLDELMEVYAIREQLEPMAIEVGAARRTDEDMAVLRTLFLRLEEAASGREAREWLAADYEYHFRMYRAARMPRLLPLIERCWNSTQQYRLAYVRRERRYDLAQAGHRLLLDAMARRDGESARHVLVSHIRRVRSTLEHAPELFT